MTHKLFDACYEHTPDAQMMQRGYYLARCPWHDDRKKSLLVFPDGWWRCIGECNTSGRLEKLYAELMSPGATSRSVSDIVRGRPPRVPSEPDEMARFVYNAHDALIRNASYRWYLEQRGVEDRKSVV